jgi:hypothetical protein
MKEKSRETESRRRDMKAGRERDVDGRRDLWEIGRYSEES